MTAIVISSGFRGCSHSAFLQYSSTDLFGLKRGLQGVISLTGSPLYGQRRVDVVDVVTVIIIFFSFATVVCQLISHVFLVAFDVYGLKRATTKTQSTNHSHYFSTYITIVMVFSAYFDCSS